MANEWHVPYELLGPDAQDMARAIQSLMEELEAVDWYHQRAQVTHDEVLRRILEHNRDEEKEHASMVLEWIRRRDPKFDQHLRTYLFTSVDIIEIEHAEGEEQHEPPPSKEAPAVTVAARESPGSGGEKASGNGLPAFTVGSLRKPKATTSGSTPP